ncbi:MAG: carboxypeptidase-like regulatory domain-containing protein [bacterium]
MRKTALILLSIMILVSGCSKAKRITSMTPFGEVEGSVMPAVAATVSVYKDTVKVQEGETDPATGTFGINNLNPGSYVMEVSAQGYETASEDFSVQEGYVTSVDITLKECLGEFAPGEVIVQFKDDVTLEEAMQIIDSYKFGVKRNLTSGAYLIGIPVGQELYWVEVLEGNSKVKYAEPNYIYYIMD